MPLATGNPLPEATFKVMQDGKAVDMSTKDVFAGKKVVFFAVPGAFTPTCSVKHLPGFLANIDAFKARGIDTVACVSVNDHHVMAAWGKSTAADGRVLMLADYNGAFSKGMGMLEDMGALGLRSHRYAAFAENGVLKILNIEPAPGVEVSSAETMLASLPR
jgi:peroxiredoxin